METIQRTNIPTRRKLMQESLQLGLKNKTGKNDVHVAPSGTPAEENVESRS